MDDGGSGLGYLHGVHLQAVPFSYVLFSPAFAFLDVHPAGRVQRGASMPPSGSSSIPWLCLGLSLWGSGAA